MHQLTLHSKNSWTSKAQHKSSVLTDSKIDAMNLWKQNGSYLLPPICGELWSDYRATNDFQNTPPYLQKERMGWWFLQFFEREKKFCNNSLKVASSLSVILPKMWDGRETADMKQEFNELYLGSSYFNRLRLHSLEFYQNHLLNFFFQSRFLSSCWMETNQGKHRDFPLSSTGWWGCLWCTELCIGPY